MNIQYVFYYKEKSGVEHISYVKKNFEKEEEEYGKIGNTEKLINFIKRNCDHYCSVVFEGFEGNRIIYILNNIADDIDIDFTIHSDEYYMSKKMIKKRGK